MQTNKNPQATAEWLQDLRAGSNVLIHDESKNTYTDAKVLRTTGARVITRTKGGDDVAFDIRTARLYLSHENIHLHPATAVVKGKKVLQKVAEGVKETAHAALENIEKSVPVKKAKKVAKTVTEKSKNQPE